jgi:hypothetical protein
MYTQSCYYRTLHSKSPDKKTRGIPEFAHPMFNRVVSMKKVHLRGMPMLPHGRSPLLWSGTILVGMHLSQPLPRCGPEKGVTWWHLIQTSPHVRISLPDHQDIPNHSFINNGSSRYLFLICRDNVFLIASRTKSALDEIGVNPRDLSRMDENEKHSEIDDRYSPLTKKPRWMIKKLSVRKISSFVFIHGDCFYIHCLCYGTQLAHMDFHCLGTTPE